MLVAVLAGATVAHAADITDGETRMIDKAQANITLALNA
jgi:hypothetical protein